MLLDVQPVTEKSPLREQLVDNIPGAIHQVIDRCFHCWSRHRTMVLLANDSLEDDTLRVVNGAARAPWIKSQAKVQQAPIHS